MRHTAATAIVSHRTRWAALQGRSVVRFSWEIGRQEDRARCLAEELALLRKDIEDIGGTRPGGPRPQTDEHTQAVPPAE